MKKSLLFITTLFIASLTFAQSDDDLFGGDDDFFEDDGIIELSPESIVSSNTAKTTDLSKGIIFENGSIKVGGSFDLGLSTSTTLYEEGGKEFPDNLADTTLTPTANATLSVDARPTETLRMYTKFGINYPYQIQASSSAQTNAKPIGNTGLYIYDTKVQTSVSEWFTLKELFSDFSIADTVFFRFGLHTVSWGTGYFFSPVSDIINTSSIDPEHPTDQVKGSLNLRTQIIFPGTQNCLWFYLIPSTNINATTTAENYAKDTALAGKAEILLGTWELGAGAFWKYQNAPKAMLTLTGGLFKINLFGEAVYQYGTMTEWLKSDQWENKTNIIQATLGFNYLWKNPAITLAGQYYFNSYHDNLDKGNISSAGYLANYFKNYTLEGHNIALALNFGKILGNSDVTASLFGMMNIGRSEMDSDVKNMLSLGGIDINSMFNEMIFSAMINISPVKATTFSCGPYFTWNKLDKNPKVDFKLSVKLGGGKF